MLSHLVGLNGHDLLRGISFVISMCSVKIRTSVQCPKLLQLVCPVGRGHLGGVVQFILLVISLELRFLEFRLPLPLARWSSFLRLFCLLFCVGEITYQLLFLFHFFNPCFQVVEQPYHFLFCVISHFFIFCLKILQFQFRQYFSWCYFCIMSLTH